MRNKALLLFLFTIVGCSSATLPPEPAQYRVIAYVRDRADIPRIGASKLTHINYAFAKVTPEGIVAFDDPVGATEHLSALNALRSRNPRLKILVSVGGWGADNFSDAALTDESRERFAQSAIALIEQHGLDGVDLDWEYPGQPGPGIKFRPEDKQNFTLLLETMRRHLGSRLLTIASTGGRYFDHVEIEKIHPLLDFFNVMTYDFAGSWSETTGHHTPLYRSGTARVASHDFIQQHVAAGIPRDKIILGVAFYGRSWRGVTPRNRGLHQSFEAYHVDVPYSELPPFKRFWDSKAKAPYLWDEAAATFVTYDDPQSLREKARYVRAQRLGGIMFWEYSHDPAETLLDVIVRALARSR